MSVLLVAEYAQPFPVMCSDGGGCKAVSQSVYSHVLGIPLPILGTAFFVALYAAFLVPALRRLLRPLALTGGVVGVVLLAIQAFVLQAYCKFCIVVDVASICSALLAWAPLSPPRRTGWLAGALHTVVLAVIVLGALALHQSMARPPAAGRSVAHLPDIGLPPEPGKVTVVEFADFECPACRAQYQTLGPLLDEYGDRLRIVLKNLPLPQHEHATEAARAYLCAEEKGKGRRMADRLFQAERVCAADCEEIAVSLGLGRNEFRDCVASPRITQRLQGDMADANTVGVRGLPTLWVGEERFEGVHEAEVLRASIEKALRRTPR